MPNAVLLIGHRSNYAVLVCCLLDFSQGFGIIMSTAGQRRSVADSLCGKLDCLDIQLSQERSAHSVVTGNIAALTLHELAGLIFRHPASAKSDPGVRSRTDRTLLRGYKYQT